MRCSKCGQEFDGRFCNNCGAPAPAEVSCKSCGTAFDGNFCPSCGNENLPPIDEFCKKLYDKNGNYIDVQKLSAVYLSKKELCGYFERNTTYTKLEIDILADYIYDTIEMEDMGFLSTAMQRSKFEMAGGGAPIKNIPFFKPILEREVRTTMSQDSQVEKYHRKSNRELKRKAHNSGQACCPKCGSVSLSANKKGFGFVKGAVGAAAGAATFGLFTGVAGLGAGNIGGKRLWVTCLNCGKRWKM